MPSSYSPSFFSSSCSLFSFSPSLSFSPITIHGWRSIDKEGGEGLVLQREVRRRYGGERMCCCCCCCCCCCGSSKRN